MKHEEDDLLESLRHIIEVIETLQTDLENEMEELDREVISKNGAIPVENLTQQWIEKLELYVARKNLLEYYRWELGFDLYYQLKMVSRKNGLTIEDPVLDIALEIFKEDANIFFRTHAN